MPYSFNATARTTLFEMTECSHTPTTKHACDKGVSVFMTKRVYPDGKSVTVVKDFSFYGIESAYWLGFGIVFNHALDFVDAFAILANGDVITIPEPKARKMRNDYFMQMDIFS
jgi:hypothetical protein